MWEPWSSAIRKRHKVALTLLLWWTQTQQHIFGTKTSTYMHTFEFDFSKPEQQTVEHLIFHQLASTNELESKVLNRSKFTYV